MTATGGTNQETDLVYSQPNNEVTNGTQTTVTSYPTGSSGSSTTSTYLFSNGVEVAETDGNGATKYINPRSRDAARLRLDRWER